MTDKEFPGFHRTYGVELLFSASPSIEHKAILDALRNYSGSQVEPVAPSDQQKDDVFLFADPKYMVSYSDGVMPAQLAILSTPKQFQPETAQESLEQSWAWPEAGDIVPRASHSVLITDLLSSALYYKDRLQRIRSAVRAALDVLNPIAIHWIASRQFIAPEFFIEAFDEDPVFPAINIRNFHVGNDNSHLMDSVGLAALGLPDVQCHFRNLNLDVVAQILYNSAAYIFEHENPIEDGNTIAGTSPDDKWICRYEEAIVAPLRTVIDFQPGPEAAAGNR